MPSEENRMRMPVPMNQVIRATPPNPESAKGVAAALEQMRKIGWGNFAKQPTRVDAAPTSMTLKEFEEWIRRNEVCPEAKVASVLLSFFHLVEGTMERAIVDGNVPLKMIDEWVQSANAALGRPVIEARRIRG